MLTCEYLDVNRCEIMNDMKKVLFSNKVNFRGYCFEFLQKVFRHCTTACEYEQKTFPISHKKNLLIL